MHPRRGGHRLGRSMLLVHEEQYADGRERRRPGESPCPGGQALETTMKFHCVVTRASPWCGIKRKSSNPAPAATMIPDQRERDVFRGVPDAARDSTIIAIAAAPMTMPSTTCATFTIWRISSGV